MRYTIFILSLLLPFLSIVALPKQEVRAAWVTAATLLNLIKILIS